MIDHLVYGTPDLAATVAELNGRLGIELSPGGRHIGLGSRNYLADLGDRRYLEVLGPDPEQPAPDKPHPFGVDRYTEPRLVGWAARVGLPDAVDRARAAGYDPGPAVPGSRRTAEGALLRWQVTHPSPDAEDGMVPFLMDWGDSPHPSQSAARGLRLVSFTGVHPDPTRVKAKLSALGLDLEVAEGTPPGLIAVLDTPNGEVELR